MPKLTPKLWPKFSDSESYLEWIKNYRYPKGIKCTSCQKITKHSKVTSQHCYVCHNCGHKISPTAGTVFYKSRTPLKTWFEIVTWMSDDRGFPSAKEIQRKFGMTYKTAWRIKHKVREFLTENNPGVSLAVKRAPGSPDEFQSSLENAGEEEKITLHNEKSPQIGTSIVGRLPFSNASDQENRRNQYQKQDRTARLLRLQMVLGQHPKGLNIAEIAQKLPVSRRTIYRDLKTLESELNVPIWEAGSRRGVIEGYFLPPINFTLEEATNIFFAARLAQNFYPRYAPGVFLTFLKLNNVAPPILKEKISYLLEHMAKQPRNEKIVKNFETLMFAWFSCRKIKILYQSSIEDSNRASHIIEPYFIEPSINGDAVYIIGFSNVTKTISSFRFDHVIGDIKIEPEVYNVPDDFDAIDHFEEAWGVHFENEILEVTLRFKPEVNYFARNLFLHPSQRVETENDGSLVMRLKVRDANDFCYRVMEWGNRVEILAPESMRNQIKESAKSLLNIYLSEGS
jgi:predicted DNA-binding transcriptional regulator YafY